MTDTPSTFYTTGNILFDPQVYTPPPQPAFTPIVMDAPNPILTTGPVLQSGALSVFGSRRDDPAVWTTQSPNDQSYFIKAARLYSNFADGLFPRAMADFWVWEGLPIDTIPFSLDRYLFLGFSNLNEWYTINKPLPRNSIVGGPIPGVCWKTNSTNWELLTLSVNPLYNGETVKIELQLEISTSVW